MACTPRMMSYGVLSVRIVKDYCLVVLAIGLSLTTAQAKNRAIALVITLVSPSEELSQN